MQTSERLAHYGVFDDDIIASIADVAAAQNDRSFVDVATQYGLEDGPHVVRPIQESSHTLQFLHLKPRADYDETKARVLCAPFGVPADENMAMRAIRQFSADPSEQLFVIGSPSVIGNPHNRPTIAATPRLARGDFDPLTVAFFAYARERHPELTHLDTLGYSYGADIAVTMAGKMPTYYDLTVNRSVWAEPASLTKRPLTQLLQDFQNSEAHLAEYVAHTESRPLFEARDLARVSSARFIGGLMRATNLAIAKGLATGTFEKRVQVALEAQPGLKATLAWGTESELTNTGDAQKIIETVGATAPGRLGALAIRGMHHAGGDDIDLHAAIMLQGLRNVS